jgi:flagellar motility protein MotE (MotC chaperone)
MIALLHPPRLLPITIFALAGLLALKSADLVRAAATSPDASPKVVSTDPAATPASMQPAPSPDPAQPAAIRPSEDTTPPPFADGERTVLLELRQRRQELDAREATLAARESLLSAAEQKVSARVTELQALQKRLETLEATRQQREDAGWQGLVKVYETMKPRDAATIFNDLDMAVLLQVVDRMKEAKAAPVLAAMQPDKARDLTARLAQMRTRRDDPGGSTVGG